MNSCPTANVDCRACRQSVVHSPPIPLALPLLYPVRGPQFFVCDSRFILTALLTLQFFFSKNTIDTEVTKILGV